MLSVYSGWEIERVAKQIMIHESYPNRNFMVHNIDVIIA